MTTGSKKPDTLDIDVTQQIRIVRGQRVLFDADLATLYGVTTKRLNEQVRRNMSRFPSDFLIQLTTEDMLSSRSQIATLKKGRGHNIKHPPLAFTEHGAIMVATILNSPQAAEMSVYVVRSFVKVRQILASNSALARRLETLEKSVAALNSDTRKEFVRVYNAILKLMGPAPREH
jgi:ORF6N domain